MGILIFLTGGLLAVLFMFFIAARVVQTLSLLVIGVLASAVVGIGYISLAVAGISAAALFQLLGANNGGWCIAVAGLIGLATAWTLFMAVVKEVGSFPERFRRWLGKWGKAETRR